jgi:hypothetical protein
MTRRREIRAVSNKGEKKRPPGEGTVQFGAREQSLWQVPTRRVEDIDG